MIGIVAHLFQIVVFTGNAEALLGVCTATRLRVTSAENDIFPLVHTRISEHQCGVVFDYHRG